MSLRRSAGSFYPLETSDGNFFLSTEQKRRRLCLVLADTSARLFRPINLYRLAGLLFYFSLFCIIFLSFLFSFCSRAEERKKKKEKKERKKHSLRKQREKGRRFLLSKLIASLVSIARTKVAGNLPVEDFYEYLSVGFFSSSSFSLLLSAANSANERDGRESI